MLSARRRLLLGALAAPLAGCVVMPYGTYYRPESADPNATTRRAWCQGQAGPVTRIELKLDGGATLTARAERDFLERDRPELPLRVELTLPDNVPARFDGGRVQILARDGAPIKAPVSVLVYGGATVAADAWVDPALLRPAGAGAQASAAEEAQGRAWIRLTGPSGFAPETFTLVLPAVDTDAGRIAVAPVELRRPASKSSPNEYRSAAEQASLEARTAACRRETPQRACENLLDFGASRSFFVDSNPVRWQGRWVRYESRSGESRLEGDNWLALRESRRWRLTSNRFILRDAGGNERSIALEQLELRFVDRIALDAPLHVQPVERRAETRVQIEALLPADAPGFELRLPPLRLGERRIAIAPIVFDKRSLDGGVEPFNC
jgi:hypothetical protein